MASLLEIRTEFIDITGRVNLVVDTIDYVDAGADVFINKGQRMLEQLVPVWQNISRRLVVLAIDAKTIDMDAIVRSIDEVVLVKESDNVKTVLIEKTYIEIFKGYSDITISGTPKCWARIPARPAPEQESGFDPTDFTGADDMFSVEANFSLKTRLLLNVPVDQAYTAQIFGIFYSNELSGDTDTSFWTDIHPHLLVMAAMYHLEVHMRNDIGAREILRDINLQLREVDHDMVDLEMGDDPIVFGG